MSTGTELYHAREAVRSTDAAFTEASRAGAALIQTILSTLATLQHASLTSTAYAPGAVAAAHRDGTEALQRLRTMVRRLGLGSAALARRCAAAAVEEEHARRVADDMDRKRSVLRQVERLVCAGEVPRHDEQSLLLGQWVEMEAHVGEMDAQTVISVIEADEQMRKYVDEYACGGDEKYGDADASPLKVKALQSQLARNGSEREELSPAVKFLTASKKK